MLLHRGMSQAEIADHLHVQPHTVYAHTYRMRRRLRLRTSQILARISFEVSENIHSADQLGKHCHYAKHSDHDKVDA